MIGCLLLLLTGVEEDMFFGAEAWDLWLSQQDKRFIEEKKYHVGYFLFIGWYVQGETSTAD